MFQNRPKVALSSSGFLAGIVLAVTTPALAAPVTVNLTVDAGGNNPNPLNGLAARATLDTAGATLKILLENTSTGLPTGTDAASALVVSLGFDLPQGVTISAGTIARLGPGASGVGAWSALAPNSSIAGDWVWTNDFGGDLMDVGGANESRQVLSSHNGLGAGTQTGFNGVVGLNVSGPYGGALDAANVGGFTFSGASKFAAKNSVYFELTLSSSLTQSQLEGVASTSVVEFGSDFQYVTPENHVIPLPASGALALAGLGLVAGRRGR